MSEEDEIVQAFLEESRENLDQVDLDVVELETRLGDPELLGRVFRAIHTIKGTCGFLGYVRLEALAHAGENLLAEARKGDLALGPEITTSLLRLVDAMRAALGRVEATGAEGEDDHRSVIGEIVGHLAHHRSPPSPSRLLRERTDPAAPSPLAVESSLRVEMAVLDKLLNLVGELVLTRSQVGQVVSDDEEGPLAQPYRQLRLITAELQESVMQARLQPVGRVTRKFRRIARDLAASLGKRIVVDLEGEDVGVDRRVSEALRDPLLHLVRNAVDHGLESPTDRVAAGKPAEGRLSIRAFHEHGRVHVDVADDGRGVDVDRLVSRAVATGVLTAGEAADLSPTERIELMFSPGLSARDNVTSMSGRGVGMDVVRTNLGQVGGSIDVSSRPGEGTVFRINVPLTLAIMPAVTVWCGGSRYVVPRVDVEEVLHFDAGEAAGRLEELGGTRVHRLRGRLLPLVELADHLQSSPRGDGGMDVVVARAQGRRLGLVVDSVGDSAEAIVKPLPHEIGPVPVFSGVTLMADGRPALILDIDHIATASGIASLDGEEPDLASAVPDFSQSAMVLLARGVGGGRLAFPLGVVRRLEQFGHDQVERIGSRELVQYRGGILPIIRVAEVLPDSAAPRPTEGSPVPLTVLHAVVCDSSIGPVGLVVDLVDDVVTRPPGTPEPAGHPGVSGRLVVEGRVTELVDVEMVVADSGIGATA